MVSHSSDLANILDILDQALVFAFTNRKPELYTLIMTIKGFFIGEIRSNNSRQFRDYQLINENINYRAPERLSSQSSHYKRLWSKLASQCNKIIRQSNFDIEIPNEAPEIPSETVFDASSYWLDWHRPERNR